MVSEQDLGRAQQLQQQLQLVAMQKQQLQLQNGEVERALSELETAKVAYRFAGSVMVQKDVGELKKQLNEEKESVELRLKSVAKQEEVFLKQFEELRKRLEPSGGDGTSMVS